jgi:hypothetical protein
MTKIDMPVQKFRSIEEMNQAPVPTDRRADFEQFLRHCARYWAMAPKVYPRGVFKFRSVEESNRSLPASAWARVPPGLPVP